jgi:hypothetical protein
MNDANDLDRLYRLLPAIYQMRDADQGYPLRALLRLIGREAKVLEDDLYQLYDGWFIETCPDWLVPYIGELIGYEPAPEAGDPANLDVSDPGGRARVLIPRRDVANTIHDRRRKGTLALLETIAGDAAGWPARAVEFFRRLGWTQNINHLHPGQGGTADLQKGRALISLNGPPSACSSGGFAPTPSLAAGRTVLKTSGRNVTLSARWATIPNSSTAPIPGLRESRARSTCLFPSREERSRNGCAMFRRGSRPFYQSPQRIITV